MAGACVAPGSVLAAAGAGQSPTPSSAVVAVVPPPGLAVVAVPPPLAVVVVPPAPPAAVVVVSPGRVVSVPNSVVVVALVDATFFEGLSASPNATPPTPMSASTI